MILSMMCRQQKLKYWHHSSHTHAHIHIQTWVHVCSVISNVHRPYRGIHLIHNCVCAMELSVCRCAYWKFEIIDLMNWFCKPCTCTHTHTHRNAWVLVNVESLSCQCHSQCLKLQNHPYHVANAITLVLQVRRWKDSKQNHVCVSNIVLKFEFKSFSLLFSPSSSLCLSLYLSATEVCEQLRWNICTKKPNVFGIVTPHFWRATVSTIWITFIWAVLMEVLHLLIWWQRHVKRVFLPNTFRSVIFTHTTFSIQSFS